jgi:hypothetical protein
LNTGEPVKKPQPNGARNVKDHLPDLDLQLAIGDFAGHCISSMCG